LGFVSTIAWTLAPPPVVHALQELILQYLAALTNHVRRRGILDDRNPFKGGNISRYLDVLLRPADTNVVKNSAGDDDFSGAFVMSSQCLQDRIFLLHSTEDVFCRHCPQSGMPPVKISLARVHKGLVVGVGLDEDIADGVP